MFSKQSFHLSEEFYQCSKTHFTFSLPDFIYNLPNWQGNLVDWLFPGSKLLGSHAMSVCCLAMRQLVSLYFPLICHGLRKEQHYPELLTSRFSADSISFAIIMRTLACMCVVKVINSTGFLYLVTFPSQDYSARQVSCPPVALLPPIFLALELSSR